MPEDEKGTVGEVELKFVKKFQKFQDHKIKLNQDHRFGLKVFLRIINICGNINSEENVGRHRQDVARKNLF